MAFQPFDVAALGVPSRIAERSLDISDPFLSSFTHDLRSPLFAILGYLQLLEKQVENKKESEKMIGYVRSAREAGLRLDQMVTEMLDLARFGHGSAAMKMEVVSIAGLFTRLWGTFHVIAHEKNISLQLSIKDDPMLAVRADARFLERALDNLIGNAIKFNRPEGRVLVSASRHNGKIIFQVSDTGRGIPEDAKSQIFEPFAQIHASDRSMGFGLGLPIVRYIARAHGGEVELTSTPGHCSCFTLWLPEIPRT